MNNSKTNTFALITGGSSGIGFAYAKEWGQKGYNLLIVSNREDLNDEAQKQLQTLFPEQTVLTRYQDLTQSDAAQQLFDFCEKENLTVEVLVNNAGMFYFGAAVEKPHPFWKKNERPRLRLYSQRIFHHCFHEFSDHCRLSGIKILFAKIFKRNPL